MLIWNEPLWIKNEKNSLTLFLDSVQAHSNKIFSIPKYTKVSKMKQSFSNGRAGAWRFFYVGWGGGCYLYDSLHPYDITDIN